MVQHTLVLDETQPVTRVSIVLPPPKGVPSHEVFAEAMLDRTSAHQRRSPLDWALSILVHASVLVLLLLAPLYFSQRLDLQKFNMTFLMTPAPPPAAPPPPPLTSALRRAVQSVPTRVFKPGILTVPTFIPKVVALSSGEVPPLEDSYAGVLGGVPGGLPGGIPGGQLGGVLGGGLNNVAKPPAATPRETPRGPVRVGGVVKPPRLLYGPEPRFPTLARQARLNGTVVIEAIIDEHGNVIEARVVSGHPLLVEAALEAVKERRYEPTFLDGEPIAIDLSVQVTFHFS
jgi:periplasmic protein TonB